MSANVGSVQTKTIVITGGAGFLGAALARRLLADYANGLLCFSEQHNQWIQGQSADFAQKSAKCALRILLLDRAAPPADFVQHSQVDHVVGDLLHGLTDPSVCSQILGPHTVAVAHLASAVSGECEADLDLGLRSNLAATQALLQALRALKTQPVLMFTSSIAVFGFAPGLPQPEVMGDFSLPTPQNSYGIQKFMCEQLVADFTRKGHVRGRSVRPMTVSVRPGLPNGAASGFLSGMVREPARGLRCTVPVAPNTAVALASPASTVAGLARALTCTQAEWGPNTAVNLPSIGTTVADMADALQRVCGAQALKLLDWQVDVGVQRLIGSWPARLSFDRAHGLGLRADTDFESIVRQHVADTEGLPG